MNIYHLGLGRIFKQWSVLLCFSLYFQQISWAQTLQLGKVHFSNSGSEVAQESFLDGLAALHCFWYQKAFEKFRQAQKLDPEFGLAYWGEAMTFNHPVWHQQDLEGARASIRSFGITSEARIAKGKTELEKSFIRSLDILYGEGTKEERDLKYRSAMESIFKKNSNNIEVTAFYALSILGSATLAEGNYKKPLQAAKIMEDYLSKKTPDALNHPGLLHYLIHAYDHPHYAKKAIQFANLYSKVAADSSHALHMPSHIYLQLGMWKQVASQNEDSYRASVKWAKIDGKGNESHDFHSLYWQLFAYLQQGRLEDAKAVLATMKEIASSDSSDLIQGYYGMMKARFAIETSQWNELSIPPTSKELKQKMDENLHAGCVGSESEHNRISSILALGIGAAKNGNTEAGEKAIEVINQLKDHYSHDPSGYNQKILDIQKRSIEGLLQFNAGKDRQGLQMLKDAAQLEEQLDPPSGPPVPAKPAIELYAEALLAQGQNLQALNWFKRSLVRTSNRTLSLTGAYRASIRLRRAREAKDYLAKLNQVLENADPSVKKVLKEHP